MDILPDRATITADVFPLEFVSIAIAAVLEPSELNSTNALVGFVVIVTPGYSLETLTVLITVLSDVTEQSLSPPQFSVWYPAVLKRTAIRVFSRMALIRVI